MTGAEDSSQSGHEAMALPLCLERCVGDAFVPTGTSATVYDLEALQPLETIYWDTVTLMILFLNYYTLYLCLRLPPFRTTVDIWSTAARRFFFV